ncbi:MAG TPA: hypothetical protein VL027_12550 [Spongiibacteraceae bacterium]|nr:hypothetical protein [Spongiibacteraceae bacterium]
MQNMRDIEALGKALAPVIAGLVSRSVERATEAFSSRIDAKCAEIDSVLQDLRDAVPEPVNANELAKAAAALMPAPKDGESVDPEVVRQMVRDVVAELPAAKDGKDADPEQIIALVKEAVAAIPAPKDGASVTLEDVQPLIDEALGKLRKDADSVFAGALEQAQRLRDQLARSIAELRQPEDGKSFTTEDAAPIIERAVAEIASRAEGKIGDAVRAAEDAARVAAEKVASLRQPEDGTSVTLDDVRPLVEEAVSEIKSRAEGAVAEATEQISSAVASLRQPEDGKSVTVEDMAPLIEEAVKREVSSIPTPMDGKSVSIDDARPVVDEAVKSAVAAIEIPEPRDGEDGRDALQLEILPAIDPGKSYPRGSYAKHAGGLWRSYESTHEMRGWECIVEGIAEHRIEQIDERSFDAVSVLSSGHEVRKTISMPVVIDRGVYRAEAEYQAGDGVTWGGSYWIATKGAPIGKPGEPGSEGWRLAVKRGDKGASAYQAAVKSGFSGTEREWLESIYAGKSPDRVVRISQ